MKMHRSLSSGMLCRVQAAAVFAAILAAPLVRAAENTLVGDWTSHLFAGPKSLYLEGGVLIGGTAFVLSTEDVRYSAGAEGAYEFNNLTVADETGFASVARDFQVLHQLPEGDQTRFMNKARDIMIAAAGGLRRGSDPFRTGLGISLRAPGTFAISDLAGSWDYRGFELPKEVSAPNLVVNTTLTGGDLMWSERSEKATVNANGALSHTDFGGEAGAFLLENGQLFLRIDGQNQACFVNASLDVILKVAEGVGDNDLPIYTLALFVRRADTVTEKDILGRWHVSNMEAPGRLRIGSQAGEPFISGAERFENENFSVTFKAGGKAVNDFLNVEFPWMLQADGSIMVWTDEGQLVLAVNRSKTFAAAIRNEEGVEVQMLLAVKYWDNETGPAPELSYERNGSEWRIVFSGGALEQASEASGPWSEVTGASSPHVMTTNGSKSFFRVRSAE